MNYPSKSLSCAMADHEFPPCATLPRISPLQWLPKGSPFAPPVQMIFHCDVALRHAPSSCSPKGFLLCEGCPRVPSFARKPQDFPFPPSIQEFLLCRVCPGTPPPLGPSLPTPSHHPIQGPVPNLSPSPRRRGARGVGGGDPPSAPPARTAPRPSRPSAQCHFPPAPPPRGSGPPLRPPPPQHPQGLWTPPPTPPSAPPGALDPPPQGSGPRGSCPARPGRGEV